MRFPLPPRLTATVAAAAIVAAVAAASPSTQAAQAPVAVYPLANTPTANPHSQISFRGASPSDLTGIRVRGSVSGDHTGTLEPHSDGQGASFVPDEPFHTGEHVRVYADVPLIGQQHGYVRFQILHRPGSWTIGDGKDPGGDPSGEQRFKTRPDIKPPSIVVTTRTKQSEGQGDVFVAAKAGPGQDGPMISDDKGHLIWFHENPKHKSAFDFRTQTYQGNPVLTWWQGHARPGISSGVDLIYDSSYRQIAAVHAGNGYHADLHEFELTPRNTALVLAYKPVTYDGETAMDTLIQEIDIPTGLVMFEWHALGHISKRYSDAPHDPGHPYDLAHLNSLQMLSDGNILVSSRHTNAVYKLDVNTGKIIWRLGGEHSDFKLSNASQFVGQHHARLQPDGSITLFDNGGPPDTGRESRALWLNVDQTHMTVNVRRSYRYRQPLEAYSQGSMQVLGNGDVFVGWGGSEPYFSEYTASGEPVWDAHFDPKGDDTYRAYRFPWTGRPTTPPDIAAFAQNGGTDVYASWNGATEVAKWQLLGGPTPDALVPMKTFPHHGFESHGRIESVPAYVAVQALDRNGATLGTSAAVPPQS